MERDALLIRGLSKSFGGVQALTNVSMVVGRGEIHGLLGENGSGKSTLIKILAGYHAPDDGQLEIGGEPVELPLAPGAFRRFGLDFVHQDLGLIPSLTVLENLRLGELAEARRRWRISWPRERDRANETFRKYGVELDPRAQVADLRPVQRALLAIIRAAEGVRAGSGGRKLGRGILILDEPTVFLPRTGIEQLFLLLREIVATGSSVVFVSHDLSEAREITDSITVLRDGRTVGTVPSSKTTEAALVEMILGRRLEQFEAKAREGGADAIRVTAEHLTGEILTNVSFAIHRGEILGVTGLAGSGFEELPYVLFGASETRAGELVLDEKRYELAAMTPPRALAVGMALIPSDRQRDGSVGSLSVTDNVTVRTLDAYFQRLTLQRRRMVRDVERLNVRFDVRPRDPRATYSSLSGGNQQRVLLAKWLQTKPKVLLLDEPTQGVDIGARQQIFAIVRDVAEGGSPVLCASSDYEQLALLCDRVLILGRGRIVTELAGDEITKDRIAEQCYDSMSLA